MTKLKLSTVPDDKPVTSAGAARSPIAFGGISLSFGARRLGLST
jgi:hypothetical protein